jgi:hypothetical protein
MVATVAATGLLVSGCASTGYSDHRQVEERAGHVDSKVLMHQFDAVDFDYFKLPATVDLAESGGVELVVEGTVSGVKRGPDLFAGDREGALLTTEIDVDVRQTYKGDAERGSTLPVVIAVGADVNALGKALPAGTAVAFYLSKTDAFKQVGDTWVPYSPQGFVVGDSDGSGVFWPLDHDLDATASLASQLP